MEAAKIRQLYFDFFASKGHEIVPSAPMVIKDDPTLMFTNAGMNQFKDVILGNAPVKFPRIANTQKCLRVSGKHNDLEEVGVDTYHHTMFEMLGNWSFGDYFKEEAIRWAWELLTEVYKLDKDRLYVTVFGGDEKDGLAADDEARGFWLGMVPADRIIACSKKDNFWEMGDTGPCGPCSEIHVDIRSDEDRAKVNGRDLVNNDHPQVIEIWNLVFMEFNRMADGRLISLPNKHIDTGMGLERLAVALQAKKSNYDTDIFSPFIAQLEQRSGLTYKYSDSKQDIAMRVISDHLRAVSFSIADGQLPSNTGAGYVIRRILRRAIRYAFSFLNLKEPFIHELVELLEQRMGHVFPELKKQKDLIAKVILEEEEAFLRTLDKGMSRLDDLIQSATGSVLSGSAVFELYDTYGFPVDLTALIAGEHGKTIDQVGFDKELQEQKERSRAAGKIETEDWVELRADSVEEFVGYDTTSAEVMITRYRKIKAKGKEQYQLVFNLTPFYAEGGGQVGDTGFIEANGQRIAITDTRRENNLIIHFADEIPAASTSVFRAEVDVDRRDATRRNHSATHLMHEALREVLGTHVEQRGSLVNSDYLRLDFSHFSKMTDEQIAEVEERVNARILGNLPLEESRNTPIDKAREAGAMMLFGEKYGDVVRMIRFGSSVELCGGTHVSATGSIGLFKITSESAVAAGVRRIEAITGTAAAAYVQKELNTLRSLREALKHPADVVKAVSDIQLKNQELMKELERYEKAKAGDVKKELQEKITNLNGVNFLAEIVQLGAAELKDIAFQLRAERSPFFGVFGSTSEGKATLTCVMSDDVVQLKGLNASTIVRELSVLIQGGGGGQPFFATAGGKRPEGLNEAIQKAASYLS